MLAYVFWHAPETAVSTNAYEAQLLRFHAALAADPPPGFLQSFTTRTTPLFWLAGDIGYEDWYLLVDSAALDKLDAAAVDAGRRGVHDSVARVTRTGVGGLYRLVGGVPVVPAETVWFSKPAGTTYADFAPVLDVAVASGSTLWQRMMVLGPAPEYAAQTRTTSVNVGERIVHSALCISGGR